MRSAKAREACESIKYPTYPNGVYVATVTCKGAKVWSEQVVVQR